MSPLSTATRLMTSLSTCRAVMVTYGVKIAVRLVRRDCGRVLSRL